MSIESEIDYLASKILDLERKIKLLQAIVDSTIKRVNELEENAIL